jgi:murein peptide amidase A
MAARALGRVRAHDYAHLVRRWRAVCRAAGMRWTAFVRDGGYSHFVAESRRSDTPGIYVSAGIHGDEPAATEGLIEWAEENTDLLRAGNFLLLPCLNPWGLVNNSRLDAQGRDLNRCYHDDAIPLVRAHKALLHRRHFALALTLHEDYDAHGVYIYEVPRRKPYWAEGLLAAASRHVPVETRTRIEGRAARLGIVRRSIRPDLLPTWPEAFVLAFHHSDRVFTIETPSELHLDDRVAAQKAILQCAVALALAEAGAKKSAAIHQGGPRRVQKKPRA